MIRMGVRERFEVIPHRNLLGQPFLRRRTTTTGVFNPDREYLHVSAEVSPEETRRGMKAINLISGNV